MKIRNGFVSNSSSSSFILKIDKIPTSVEETRVMLFGENPPMFTTHGGDEAILTKKVSEIIYRDISDPFLMDLNEMIHVVLEEIHSFDEHNYYKGHDFVKGTKYETEFDELYNKVMKFEKNSNKFGNDWDWKNHYDKLDEMSKPMLELVEKSIREKYNKDDKFIQVEYSDNDGQIFAYIEHGSILKPFIVQMFSHH